MCCTLCLDARTRRYGGLSDQLGCACHHKPRCVRWPTHVVDRRTRDPEDSIPTLAPCPHRTGKAIRGHRGRTGPELIRFCGGQSRARAGATEERARAPPSAGAAVDRQSHVPQHEPADGRRAGGRRLPGPAAERGRLSSAAEAPFLGCHGVGGGVGHGPAAVAAVPPRPAPEGPCDGHNCGRG